MKLTFAIVSAALLALSARAQIGFDSFGATRTLVVASPAQITSTTTNAAVDIRMFTGIVKLDIMSVTNVTAADSVKCSVQTSSDTTNWTALANYALAVSSTVKYTNNAYGNSTPIATNTYLLPGTITTPTAATAGWATAYLAPAAFTNSGDITVTSDGAYSIGFKADDQSRYLRVYWTLGAGATNSSVGAILTGRLLGGPGAP